MRITALASGSSGNAYLVGAGTTRVLLDAGLPAPVLERYLRGQGVGAARLAAIFVSHEHTDHLCGVGGLARRHRLPVFATPGTFRAGADPLGRLPEPIELAVDRPVQVGSLVIRPFPVAHDAAEPVAFCVEGDGFRIGLCTDLGQVTPAVRAALAGVDLLIIEANHDRERLRSGPYHWALKRRVGGPTGHLSNSEAAALVQELATIQPPHAVWLAHLSTTNNTPDLARTEVQTALAQIGHAALPVAVVGRDRPSLAWDSATVAARPSATSVPPAVVPVPPAVPPNQQLALPW